VASRSAKLVLARPGTAPSVSTTSTSVPTTAPIARPYRAPSAANTRPGVTVSSTWRSLEKSVLTSEYGGEVGT
jgi:hypothetical protein